MENTKGSILVIDDNEINRKYVKTVLKNLNRTIHLADSGFNGIEVARVENVALALIDIQMPIMDGFECHDKIREVSGLEVPIIAITAFSDVMERDRFISYGFNDYISKPVKPEVLKNTVKYWLNESDKATPEEQRPTVDFDIRTIEELKRYTNTDELIELYKEFIEETNISNQKLLFLQDANDDTEILSILHTIKGNAGSLGFAKLSELVARLESDVKNKIEFSLNERISEIVDYSSFIFNNYEKQLNLKL